MIDLIKIPAKSTFKLNEVCQITGVKPYVLKFWEEQFEEINPTISATGQKLFEHQDIQAIALVKKLLFEEKLSVDQAKDEIKLRMVSSETREDLVEQTDEENVAHDVADQTVQADLEEFSIALKDAIDLEDARAKNEDIAVEEVSVARKELDNEQNEATEVNSDAPRAFKKVDKSIFSDKDKQNLVLAKAKLQNMLMLASQIQTRESWQ